VSGFVGRLSEIFSNAENLSGVCSEIFENSFDDGGDERGKEREGASERERERERERESAGGETEALFPEGGYRIFHTLINSARGWISRSTAGAR